VPGSSARATHDRWTAFLHANVYEAMLRELAPARYTTNPSEAEGIKVAAVAYTRQHFEILETQLGPGPYLLGDRLQMFDIYLWMLCHWVDAAWLTEACPRIRNLQLTATARPALAAVAARHFE
jgi:glutathione S-transferase